MRKIFLLFVFSFICSLWCNAQTEPLYKQKNAPVEDRIKDLIGRMTLEEKMAQIRHVHSYEIFNGQELDYDKLAKKINNLSWGFVEGFPLTGENCRQNFRAIQKYCIENTRLGIPIFTVGESLHGSAHEGSTIFPQNIALGSTFNPDLANLRAKMTSKDLHSQGIRQVLAPCIDVVRDLRWGRVEEAYAEDPYLSGVMAVAEVKGYQESGIAPMLKHYGPHGNPLGGLNLASVECGMRDLHSVYLKPFEMVVKQTPLMAVMSTYNSWNHLPNSASYYLLTEILRNEWGFEGYVYSDWGAISMLQSFHRTAGSRAEAAVQALSAGLDVEASSNCYPELIKLVNEDKFDIEIINKSVERVLRAKFAAGLFDDPFGAAYGEHEMHSDESVRLSRLIADESTVLLKNDNNLLPLDASKLKSIAVLGPNADQVQFGDYTWSRDNKDGVTPLAGLRNLLGDKVKLNYAKGCSMMSLDKSMIPEAVGMAEKSDVAIIFCGSSSASLARDYSNTNCGEGFDLHDLNLTGAQGDLIKAVHATGKPVVLVLVSGKPFAISWEKENVTAIIAQWYAGEQAGNSIADILFGKVNPSGHLTYSFPQSAGHLPAYYNYLPSDKGFYRQPGSYEKPGRDYVFASTKNLWSFGHGLSYTTFGFENLKTDRKNYNDTDMINITVQLTNTGKYEGKEVVQVYVRDIVSTYVTPIKQLRAFKKVNLKPGESKTIELQVPVAELYIMDENNRRYVEAGDFEIQVGNSSDNILLKEVITVGGKSEEIKGNDVEKTVIKPGKTMRVNGTIRDVQATLIPDVVIYSTLLKKEVGKTDRKGQYKIDVPDNDSLIFTKGGYQKQTLPVNNQKNLNVKLDYGG